MGVILTGITLVSKVNAFVVTPSPQFTSPTAFTRTSSEGFGLACELTRKLFELRRSFHVVDPLRLMMYGVEKVKLGAPESAADVTVLLAAAKPVTATPLVSRSDAVKRVPVEIALPLNVNVRVLTVTSKPLSAVKVIFARSSADDLVRPVCEPIIAELKLILVCKTVKALPVAPLMVILAVTKLVLD